MNNFMPMSTTTLRNFETPAVCCVSQTRAARIASTSITCSIGFCDPSCPDTRLVFCPLCSCSPPCNLTFQTSSWPAAFTNAAMATSSPFAATAPSAFAAACLEGAGRRDLRCHC
eukprot:4229369-Amphidinium_carterae.2